MLDSGSLTILNPALVNSAYAYDSAVMRRRALSLRGQGSWTVLWKIFVELNLTLRL